MRLHELKPARRSRSARRRVGRGMGSGLGKTAGRGEKGQKSRQGYSSKPGFEGGQMPLVRRVPKRGFTNIFRKDWVAINVARLEGLSAGTEVTPELLRERGWVPRGAALIKVLGHGELSVPLQVRVHGCSATASRKIQAAGGSVETLSVKPRGPKNRKLSRKERQAARAAQGAGEAKSGD